MRTMSMVKEELISTLAAPVSVHSVSKYASTFTCKRKHDTALSCCGCLFDSRFVLPTSWVFQKAWIRRLFHRFFGPQKGRDCVDQTHIHLHKGSLLCELCCSCCNMGALLGLEALICRFFIFFALKAACFCVFKCSALHVTHAFQHQLSYMLSLKSNILQQIIKVMLQVV